MTSRSMAHTLTTLPCASVVMEAYDYLSGHLKRDMSDDIRVENYSEPVENSDTIGEKVH